MKRLPPPRGGNRREEPRHNNLNMFKAILRYLNSPHSPYRLRLDRWQGVTYLMYIITSFLASPYIPGYTFLVILSLGFLITTCILSVISLLPHQWFRESRYRQRYHGTMPRLNSPNMFKAIRRYLNSPNSLYRPRLDRWQAVMFFMLLMVMAASTPWGLFLGFVIILGILSVISLLPHQWFSPWH